MAKVLSIGRPLGFLSQPYHVSLGRITSLSAASRLSRPHHVSLGRITSLSCGHKPSQVSKEPWRDTRWWTKPCKARCDGVPLELLPDTDCSWSIYAGIWISFRLRLVHSFVTSRVDSCNSLLASAPVYQTDQLQRVLNAAAHLLLRVPRFDLDFGWRSRTDFIGCVFRNAWLSSCVYSYTSRSTARLHRTWLSCATRSPATHIAGTSAPARTS